MDHTPQDRQIPGEPSPAADVDRSGTGPEFPTTTIPARERLGGPGSLASPSGEPDPTSLANGSSGALCMACVDGIPSDPGSRGNPVSSPVPAPPLISADAAARALQEYFLANADRGDDAANDELVAEMLRRIRALRASHERGC